MLLRHEKLRAVRLPLRRMMSASRHKFAFNGVAFGCVVARRGARPAARAPKAQRGIRPGRRAMPAGAPRLSRESVRQSRRLLRRTYADKVRSHVEMPPCPLGLLVVKRHQPAAYRTYRGALRILQPDVDSTCGNVQLHIGHGPLLAESEKCCIVLVENVFHADIIPQIQNGCLARSCGAVARATTFGVSNRLDQAALSTKNSEEPKLFCRSLATRNSSFTRRAT